MARNSNKEIITYDAPWTVYSMSWCRGREDYCSTGFRMAIGSFREEYSNQVQVIQLRDNENSEHDSDVASMNESKAMKRNESSEEVSSSFQPICQFDHPYPPTKICWAPANNASSVSTDLLASSGDYLRLWGIDKDNNAELKRLFNSTKDTDYCAPITSFDWNEVDASIIGAVSMDTTCTIWDINVPFFVLIIV